MAGLGATSVTAALFAIVSISSMIFGASCGGGSSATGTAGTGGGGNGAAGTGGGGSGPPPSGSPAADCAEAEKTICKRSASCDADAGAGAEEQCLAEFQTVFGCDRATMSFADCLTDVKLVSCSSLKTSFPGSCEDPFFSIPLSPAQMKCDDLGGALCRRSAKCQGITPTAAQLEACMAEFFADADCLFATAVNEQCAADVAAAPCAAPDAGATPDAGAITPACEKPITWVD
jgi:hypothetical protein